MIEIYIDLIMKSCYDNRKY